jgi:hypothetical protein
LRTLLVLDHCSCCERHNFLKAYNEHIWKPVLIEWKEPFVDVLVVFERFDSTQIPCADAYLQKVKLRVQTFFVEKLNVQDGLQLVIEVVSLLGVTVVAQDDIDHLLV